MLRTSALFVLVALLSIQLSYCIDESSETKIVEATTNDKPHNINVGKKINGERLLDHQEVKGKRRLLRWVEYDYEFPSDDEDDNTYKISRVVVQNKQTDEEGGYPKITSGGPKSDHVKIHIDSRWNKGFDFEIKIYGRETSDEI